jgi:hypothetical protein
MVNGAGYSETLLPLEGTFTFEKKPTKTTFIVKTTHDCTGNLAPKCVVKIGWLLLWQQTPRSKPICISR